MGFVLGKRKKVKKGKNMKIENLSTCTGCSACYAACPHGAITMKQDREGFYIPVITENLCTQCGLCDKTCPVLEPAKPVAGESKEFAIINHNEIIRRESSSGGVFTAIARQVLDKGGVVFGARYDDNLDVVHGWTEDEAGLKDFRGSKYTQSNLMESFRECRDFLKAGRLVLFSGTPCQIAGLQSFLRKPYENLLLVDFICHGVPSPKLWQEYKKFHEKKSASRIVRTASRRKDCGWKQYSLAFTFVDASEYCQTLNKDYYLQLFLRDMCLMNSCYQCGFKTQGDCRRPADITLADFWGVGKEYPELDDDKGTSLVVAHSHEGQELLHNLENCLVKEIPVESGIRYNPSYYSSCKKPSGRNTFFDALAEVEQEKKDVLWLYKKYGVDSFPLRVYKFARRCGGKMLRMLGIRK